MTNKTQVYRASFLVALSGILYGFLGYFGTKSLQENSSVSNMLLWRFVIAGVSILFFSHKNNKKYRPLDKHTLLLIFILGSLGYASSSAFYFIASQYTGTSLSMVIFFSYPIPVAIFSCWMDKNNFNLSTFFVLIALVFGSFLLHNASKHTWNITGILFAILAAFCYAFYIIGSKRFATHGINSNSVTIIICFSCALTFLVVSIITHTFSLPSSFKNWLYLLGLGLFATAMPIQLMFEGLKHISPLRASIISVLEPLLTVFIGVLLLDESLSLIQTLGVLIILSSTILFQFQESDKK